LSILAQKIAIDCQWGYNAAAVMGKISLQDWAEFMQK